MAGWRSVTMRRSVVPAAVFALVMMTPGPAYAADLARTPPPVISSITEFTSACGGQNNEIEQATWHQYVYEEWIGCGGLIGFALDHGKTFPQVRRLVPKKLHNFGDRDFIAVSPSGAVYLTWDYGPSAKQVTGMCSKGGSCSFLTGDLNTVMQKSTDGGRTWGPMVHISPGYPTSGGESGPLLITPDGKIYVDYHAFRMTGRNKLTLTTAHNFVTSSGNGGKTWSKPVRVGPARLSMNRTEWWIDGAMSSDLAGNLYATWDSQVRGRDIGWLAYSTNHGRTWSTVRVTPDSANVPHIVQVAGGRRGVAYVGWLADNSRGGYALYLREFSIRRRWLSPIVRVSRQYGNKAVWPGDTFGISVEPGVRTGPLAGRPRVVVSWGSATHKISEDRAAIVTFR